VAASLAVTPDGEGVTLSLQALAVPQPPVAAAASTFADGTSAPATPIGGSQMGGASAFSGAAAAASSTRQPQAFKQEEPGAYGYPAGPPQYQYPQPQQEPGQGGSSDGGSGRLGAGSRRRTWRDSDDSLRSATEQLGNYRNVKRDSGDAAGEDGDEKGGKKRSTRSSRRNGPAEFYELDRDNLARIKVGLGFVNGARGRCLHPAAEEFDCRYDRLNNDKPWLLRDTALRVSGTPTRCPAVLMLSFLITVVDERNLGTQAEPAPPKPVLGGLRRTASGNLVPVADDAPIQCAAASLAKKHMVLVWHGETAISIRLSGSIRHGAAPGTNASLRAVLWHFHDLFLSYRC